MVRINAMGWLGSTALTASRAPLKSASGSDLVVRIANIIPGGNRCEKGRYTAGSGASRSPEFRAVPQTPTIWYAVEVSGGFTKPGGSPSVGKSTRISLLIGSWPGGKYFFTISSVTTATGVARVTSAASK